jgi:hypothetical protein
MAATTGECSTLILRRIGARDPEYSLEGQSRVARLEREDSRCMGMVEYIWRLEGCDTFVNTDCSIF